MTDSSSSRPWMFRIGDHELIVRYRYELLSIINDVLIALWFIVGSILFFDPSMSMAGTWMFLLGSIELAIRPTIRLARHIHLRQLAPGESDQDF